MQPHRLATRAPRHYMRCIVDAVKPVAELRRKIAWFCDVMEIRTRLLPAPPFECALPAVVAAYEARCDARGLADTREAHRPRTIESNPEPLVKPRASFDRDSKFKRSAREDPRMLFPRKTRAAKPYAPQTHRPARVGTQRNVELKRLAQASTLGDAYRRHSTSLPELFGSEHIAFDEPSITAPSGLRDIHASSLPAGVADSAPWATPLDGPTIADDTLQTIVERSEQRIEQTTVRDVDGRPARRQLWSVPPVIVKRSELRSAAISTRSGGRRLDPPERHEAHVEPPEIEPTSPPLTPLRKVYAYPQAVSSPLAVAQAREEEEPEADLAWLADRIGRILSEEARRYGIEAGI